MPVEENEAITRQLADSMEAAMTAAQEQLVAAEMTEAVQIATLALQSIPVARWGLPGPSAPLCAQCGRIDQWYQRLDTGIVRCWCQLSR